MIKLLTIALTIFMLTSCKKSDLIEPNQSLIINKGLQQAQSIPIPEDKVSTLGITYTGKAIVTYGGFPYDSLIDSLYYIVFVTFTDTNIYINKTITIYNISPNGANYFGFRLDSIQADTITVRFKCNKGDYFGVGSRVKANSNWQPSYPSIRVNGSYVYPPDSVYQYLPNDSIGDAYKNWNI